MVKVIIGREKEDYTALLLAKEQTKNAGFKEFDGEEGNIQQAFTQKNYILVGLGEEKKVTKEKIRRSTASVIEKATQMKLKSVAIEFLDLPEVQESQIVEAITEASILTSHSFTKYKKKKHQIEKIVIKAGSELKPIVDRAVITSENENLIKDWVNDSPTLMNTTEMEKLCKDVCKKAKIKITVLNDKQLLKKKMNMIYAVGKGATSGPRLVIAEYNGNKSSKEKIALVGKGIVFDSGGINLKPSGYIETMKTDKAGALTVLATMKTAAELKLKVNILGLMPFCENAIGPDAYKPGDIIRSYSGKTVEIGNTDAEGRVILGDALAYAVEQKPKYIIDLATLTGACVVALGDYMAGLFTNDKDLARRLSESGEITGEQVWELPLNEDYEKDIESQIADIKNIGRERNAGATAGAAFLKAFVGNTPWVHLDIAGTAWWNKKAHYMPQGATGWGVRLLTDFLEKL
jgi:leucyl aminopeptidase